MARILPTEVEQEDAKLSPDMSERERNLVSWVMDKVNEWEEYRNSNFKDKWDEYYRLWRGIWQEGDKTRDSERSRLISPALQQAIESFVAEIEEATFGRGRFFDVSDDVSDQEKMDMYLFHTLLEEDMNEVNVEGAISETFLNAALYGTGVSKIVVEEDVNRIFDAVEMVPGVKEFEVQDTSKVVVRLVPVSNDEFVIDPSATSIESALGMAHVMGAVPRHSIESKQKEGIYLDYDLGSYPDDIDLHAKGEQRPPSVTDKVKIVEYHGLVPMDLLLGEEKGEDEDESDGMETEYDELVEAIVTIANDGVLLKAVENPYKMKDRCFIAFQCDTVPNRFWGRGIAEKGYNPQKALDAELRGRMDAMALAIHPMMAMDATRIPRGGDMSVRPGRTILTNGDPRTILMPFNFGGVSQATFAQAGEFERMIQMGTGAMDSATPVNVNPRNSTASGMSMILGGMIKRSKRTLANISRNYITPMIKKFAWRYMQFDPNRYPIVDFKFRVHSTLGIMAREMEQQQLTGLLQTVPADGPAYWMLIRGIYENSSISNREEMLAIVDQMLQQVLNPQPPQPSFQDQLKSQELQLKAQNEQARIQVELLRARAEIARVTLEAQKAVGEAAKVEAETMLDLAKADAAALQGQLAKYKAMTDALQAESERNFNAGTQQGTSPETV